MKLRKYHQTVLATALSLGLLTLSTSAAAFFTIDELLTPTTTDKCERDITSDLKFVINDTVVDKDVVLSPLGTFTIGNFLKIELVEDLRVCVRYDRVDLWIALEMPDGKRFFMVESPLPPFVAFVLEPTPFKDKLGDEQNTHSVLNFEVVPGLGGTYRLFAAYSEAGKDISELLFTLRSNRANAEVILDNN